MDLILSPANTRYKIMQLSGNLKAELDNRGEKSAGFPSTRTWLKIQPQTPTRALNNKYFDKFDFKICVT